MTHCVCRRLPCWKQEAETDLDLHKVSCQPSERPFASLHPSQAMYRLRQITRRVSCVQQTHRPEDPHVYELTYSGGCDKDRNFNVKLTFEHWGIHNCYAWNNAHVHVLFCSSLLTYDFNFDVFGLKYVKVEVEIGFATSRKIGNIKMYSIKRVYC